MVAPRSKKPRNPTAAKQAEPEAMPQQVAPMLASLSKLPKDHDRWAYEFKWDGVRAMCYFAAGRMKIESRNLIDVTARYPEVHPLADAVRGHDDGGLILDGEIIALDEEHRPSFGLLQSRMHVRSPEQAGRLSLQTPVVLMLFDVLMHRGRWLLDEPYEKRREVLESLNLSTNQWQTPISHVGEGAEMLEAATRMGLEGVVAKRLGSPYQPGVRSDLWRKIKITARQAFVIVGYQAGRGSMHGTVGSLLTAYYEKDDQGNAALRYAGKVGTGMTDVDRRSLHEMLKPIELAKAPDIKGQAERGVQWVRPKFVADVEFRGWTPAGRLRQPAFKGMRADKPPESVTRQLPIEESS